MTTPTPETPAIRTREEAQRAADEALAYATEHDGMLPPVIVRGPAAPETPAGGLTTDALAAVVRDGLAKGMKVRARFVGHPLIDAVVDAVAPFVAAAVVQARAEDRARIEAVRAYVDDPGNWSAFDGRRAHLLNLLDGDRP